jgi:hypothetical protein
VWVFWFVFRESVNFERSCEGSRICLTDGSEVDGLWSVGTRGRGEGGTGAPGADPDQGEVGHKVPHKSAWGAPERRPHVQECRWVL